MACTLERGNGKAQLAAPELQGLQRACQCGACALDLPMPQIDLSNMPACVPSSHRNRSRSRKRSASDNHDRGTAEQSPLVGPRFGGETKQEASPYRNSPTSRQTPATASRAALAINPLSLAIVANRKPIPDH